MEDARRHHAMERLKAQAEAVRQQELLRRAANPTVRPAGEEEEDEDDEEDDEEFRRYKLERLREMQKHASTSAALPVFGHVEAIEALEMPAAIDNVGSPHSYVVVLLHEDFLASCVRLRLQLEEIAARHDQVSGASRRRAACTSLLTPRAPPSSPRGATWQVRFLAVSASAAKPDLDPAELPLLLAYQAGNFLASSSRVGKSAADGLPLAKVEESLLRMGVRLTSASQMKAADAAALRRLKELDLGGIAPAAGGEEDESEEGEEEEEVN